MNVVKRFTATTDGTVTVHEDVLQMMRRRSLSGAFCL